MEENCEMIWKIWKKSKSNSDNIWKKRRLNCDMIWKISKKGKSNSDKIWTIWNKGKLNSEKI